VFRLVNSYEKYAHKVVCSVACVDKENRFKGFISSDKYQKKYWERADGTVRFDSKYNNKLKEFALDDLNQKINKLKKETELSTFGKIIFR